jgi:hypothetical protein
MQFIDNTGHIFEMQSYSEYPVGFEYETTPYIFWLNSEYSNKLSVRNYYALPIRMLFESTNDIIYMEVKNIKSDIYSFANINEENIEINESELKKEINLNDVYFLNGVKGKNSDSVFNIGTFYVLGYAKTEGTWLTTICIHYILSDGKEYWCPITIGGVYIDECEELVINARNIGVQLPKDIIKAVYQGQIDNDSFDEQLYNLKLKEYLINHMTIKGQCGNYNSVLASLEWFGWGNNIEISKILLNDNEFIEQYIHDYFDINNDLLDSFKKFKNTTYIALTVYANQETYRVEKVDDTKSLWGEGKPVLEDLFEKTIETEKNGLKILKHYYDYTFHEMLYKLSCLSYMLKKYFLPIHLSIHSATIQERVFANDIKYLNSVSLNLTEKPILIGDNMNSNIVNEVTFEDTNKYILSNQTLVVDDNYNIFNHYTTEFASNSDDNFILIDDKLCVEIPIYFNSYNKTSEGLKPLEEQTYNCVLILRRNNITIHESHFSFVKNSELDYQSFVVIPKVFNESINADFWENGQFTIDILCNGLWYRKNFILDVPEFILNFNKLQYLYDAEYHKQLSGYDSSALNFNAVMYEPNLVTFNDINFDKEMIHLCKHPGLGAFNRSFSTDFNIYSNLKLIDYYISLTEQAVKFVDNDKYLNRIYVYNINDIYGSNIKYNGTPRFESEKESYTFTQEVLNIYKDFFTTSGDQILTNTSLNDYDFYLMHDDNIFYAVFISKDTINNLDLSIEPDELIQFNNYILRKYKYNDLFLINRMMLVPNEGVNQFTNEDIVVASIQNNENLAFNMSLGSKWEFKHISLGAEDIEPVTSKTNVAIMSVDKDHIKYVKGYYNVTVNYSIDDYYSHNKTMFGKILIK